jgi:hypothetical protein
MSADFAQHDGSNYTNNGVVNYDMMMGDGVSANSAYDENGNIKAMKQWGMKLGSSSVIDELSYQYFTSSNKLLSVSESSAIGNTNQKLGDFTDGNYSQSVPADYSYDANGNLITDLNKQFYGTNNNGVYSAGIPYNCLNLPWQIKAHPGQEQGTITYTYDALGNKLEKHVQEDASASNGNQARDNKTTYIGGFVYENDQLQFVAHEEGRIRFNVTVIFSTCSHGCDPVPVQSWNIKPLFDYFVKDHLGNVRMVLTDQKQTDYYQA